MPVRDLDGWLPATDRAIAVRSNRGANGIDGVVSTALGSAAVAGGPVALVVGDLSFLHDLNALVAAKLHDLSATIVLVNNDGGGIFSFLPQGTASSRAPACPTGTRSCSGRRTGSTSRRSSRRWAASTSLSGRPISRAQVERSIGCPGVQVLELRTDRARNVALHREVAALVAEAILAVSGIVVDGLRWEVRTRGDRAAAAPGPRVHRPRDLVGRPRGRFRAIVPDDRRRPPGHGRTRSPADPRRAASSARRTTWPTILRRLGAAPAPSSATRSARGSRCGSRSPIRTSSTGSSSRARPPGSPTVARGRAPGRGRRAAERIERDGIPAFVAGWEAHRSSPARSRCRRRRAPGSVASASPTARTASPSASAPPARARWSRSRPPGRGPAPTLVIAGALDPVARPRRLRSPPASRAPGSPSSPTGPHAARETASRLPSPRPRLPAGGPAA